MGKLIAIYLASKLLIASTISYKTYSNKQITYSFSQVCTHYGVKHIPLVERESYRTLNCMGKKVDISDFCYDKHGTSPLYTKGFIPKEQEKVVCEKSQRVTLQYQCDSENDNRCLTPESGCKILGSQLARNLDVSHFSAFQKNLRCEFSANAESFSPIGDSQDLLVPLM